MVLVQASLVDDESQLHPDNPLSAASIITGPAATENFSVRTGELHPVGEHAIEWKPDDNASYSSVTVNLVSGGKKGDRLIDRVFVGWVNNLGVQKCIARYTGGHTFSLVLDDAPPFLDTMRPDAGSGGNSVTPVVSMSLPRKKLSVGERRTEESLDSPFFNAPVRHPDFSTSRLQRVRFEMRFSAHLCLWTDRGADGNFVARHCYGVLLSYDWQVLGEWTIDNDKNVTEITSLSASPPISGAVTRNPLAKPKDARCEIGTPTVQALTRTKTT